MTDMTSDMMDTQAATDAPREARRKTERTEFTIYFAIIFLATLPLATLTWALSAIRSRSFTEKGPLARAWSQARIITPMIFAA